MFIVESWLFHWARIFAVTPKYASSVNSKLSSDLVFTCIHPIPPLFFNRRGGVGSMLAIRTLGYMLQSQGRTDEALRLYDDQLRRNPRQAAPVPRTRCPLPACLRIEGRRTFLVGRRTRA